MTRYQFFKSVVGTKKAIALIHSLKSQKIYLDFSDLDTNYRLTGDFIFSHTTQGKKFWWDLIKEADHVS